MQLCGCQGMYVMYRWEEEEDDDDDVVDVTATSHLHIFAAKNVKRKYQVWEKFCLLKADSVMKI